MIWNFRKKVQSKIPDHLIPTVELIQAAKIGPPPSPWKCVGGGAVGGLQSVGFRRNTDLLLVTSSQGSGVFNAIDGQRIARDRSDDCGEDEINLEAIGIGPLERDVIRMAGINGGGLPKSTSDGWQAERFVLQWPEETILLVPPGSWIYGASFGKRADFVKVFVGLEIRAWGFSPTGKSLVLATSSDVTIYAR